MHRQVRHEQGFFVSTMSRIYKGDLTANFSIVKRVGFEDERLSWKSKGILAYLLTRPDDWQTYLKQLEKVSKDGRESTANAVKELQKFGYMRKKAKQDENGKFCGWDWEVYGSPKIGETVIRESRNTGKPKHGKAVIDNKKEVTKKKVTKKDLNNTRFEKFWNDYKKKVDRAKCQKKFNRLTIAEQDACLASVPLYIDYLKKTGGLGQYQKNPLTYLNGKCWETEWEALASQAMKRQLAKPQVFATKPKTGTSYDQTYNSEFNIIST